MFFIARYFLVVLVIAPLAGTLSVHAQEYLPELVRRIKPSAVAIETFDARGETISRGSGFFTGYDRVVTNRHVLERSARVVIHLSDGRKFPVKGVLAIDGEGDLAMLQVDIPPQLARPLPIVRTVPQEGESVVVVGNPFGLEGSVSNGIVSAVRDIAGYGRIIQITAPISSGSSGSPVVNMTGQVIGVATLQAAEGQSLNFAVPAERILQLRVGEARSFASLSAETQQNKRAAAERFYSQGVAQLSRDDYARALPFFEKAAELDASYAEAWYQVAFCNSLLGQHSDALKASRNAAKLRPDWAAAHAAIGSSSFALGQFNEAAEAFRQALRLDENAPDTQYSYGLTLNKLGRHDEEVLAYKRAIDLKPDHANALEKLGQAYFRQKKWAEAAYAFEALRTYRPDAKTYNALGECYLELDRPEDALLSFNNALGYDPNLDQARFNLGRAYLRSGNKEMAQVQYEILRNSRSDWADRLLVLLNQ